MRLKIKEWRKIRGLTQAELAERSNINQSYISILESDHRKKSPTLKILQDIASVLNICIFDLMECDYACATCKCDKVNCTHNESMD